MKKYRLLICSVCLLTISLIVFFAVINEKKAKSEVIENAGIAEHAIIPTSTLEYNGDKQTIKKHIDTLLLIGTDSDDYAPSYGDGTIAPYYNYEQADFIVLLVLDNDEKTCTPIQINRDTMVDDPWLSVTGEVGGTVFEQIALSHTTGSGSNDSCINTRNSVSSLLFNLPIDNYLAISMASIPILNDLVGGVTVTIVDDMTAVDESFVQGKTVTLYGERSLKFVRARINVGDGTNVSRMRRHRDYLDGFFKNARESFNSDSELAMKAIEKLSPYMVTDLTAEEMSNVAAKLDTYEMSQIQYAMGENKLGEQFYEFYVDYQDLWKIIKGTVCEP